MNEGFLAPISEQIWREKYRFVFDDGRAETNPGETFARVARTSAAAESADQREFWREAFERTLSDYRFLPAGRILAGAGTDRRVTLFNCFVMGTLEDSLDGIFTALRESALTLQTGGGIGVDFSTLRPRGAEVRSIGADASGPVSFMEVWDAMCRTIMSAGARRGAMMATLRADHPDIEDFIAAKSKAGRLTNFNLSVLVPDALMEAVKSDGAWTLHFGGQEVRKLRARDLWSKIMSATYETSEPGVIFIDRVNQANNLAYCETIHTTNPCGEQPLPPYGACLLGSFNLARYIRAPFSPDAKLATDALRQDVRVAVRMLDNLIDVSHYPLPQQEDEAKKKRRVGLGVTGLADALVLIGQRYDAADARATARGWMSLIQSEAYAASAALAQEKGPFPLCNRKALSRAPNIARLPRSVRDAIQDHGLRNGCLTSIAPTGTISLLAGNVSSGIEPIFDMAYTRTVRAGRDEPARTVEVEDYAYALFRRQNGRRPGKAADLPKAFVTATQLSAESHLAMQAALQPYVDSSISKTINVPAQANFDDVADIYATAHDLGLKGCTTYRPSALRGSILTAGDGPQKAAAAAPVVRTDRNVPAVDNQAVAEGPAADADKLWPGAGNLQSDDTAAVTKKPTADRQGASAVERQAPAVRDAGDGIVYMAEPLARDRALAGVTYKLKWPGSSDAIYVTLNDIEVDGRRRPFEIFINTRNLEHYTWTVALTRMISAVFRRGGDVSFVAEELKAIFDPQGGRWIEGRYEPSLIAAIGNIIEEHLRKIAFARRAGPDVDAPDAHKAEPLAVAALEPPDRHRRSNFGSPVEVRADAPGGENRLQAACPTCGAHGLERREGCWICARCGFSRCD